MKNNAQYKFILLIILEIAVLIFLVTNISIIPETLRFVVNLFFPFLLGGAIAFVINVPMKKIEHFLIDQFKLKNSLSRIIALLFAVIIVVGLFAFVLFLIVPSFVNALVDVAKQIPILVQDVGDSLIRWFDDIPGIEDAVGNIEKTLSNYQEVLVEFATTSISKFVNQFFNVITSTISVLFNVIVAIFFSLYLLLSKETLKRQYKKMLFAFLSEKQANWLLDFGTLTHHSFSNFVTGQVTEAFINGILTYIGTLIFGFPYGIVLAVLVGFCALIPYFGAFIGSAIGAILIGSQSMSQALVFVIFQIIVQQIDGNIIYPRVVGNSIGLPAIWVMVAVTLGANVWGLVGMVLMVPLASVLYSLFSMYTNRRLNDKNINVDTRDSNVLGELFPRDDVDEEVIKDESSNQDTTTSSK